MMYAVFLGIYPKPPTFKKHRNHAKLEKNQSTFLDEDTASRSSTSFQTRDNRGTAALFSADIFKTL